MSRPRIQFALGRTDPETGLTESICRNVDTGEVYSREWIRPLNLTNGYRLERIEGVSPEIHAWWEDEDE